MTGAHGSTHHQRHRRAEGRSSASTSATATASRSPRSGSTSSPTPPATTSGSTSTSSGPRRRARSAARSPTATSRCRSARCCCRRSSRSTGFKMGVNYGADKIRFMSPVPVGAKLRLGVKLLEVDDIAGGVQTTMEFTFEVEGAAKPSLRRRGHLPPVRVTSPDDGVSYCWPQSVRPGEAVALHLWAPSRAVRRRGRAGRARSRIVVWSGARRRPRDPRRARLAAGHVRRAPRRRRADGVVRRARVGGASCSSWPRTRGTPTTTSTGRTSTPAPSSCRSPGRWRRGCWPRTTPRRASSSAATGAHARPRP